MAKKTNKKAQAAGPKGQTTSNISTNLTPSGMIKDTDASYLGNKNWSHAINAINNSIDGDTGVIGNEPANLSCAEIPYPVIGTIHLYADKWVLFSTNTTESEIGTFDDSSCEYQSLVNDRCLSFNTENLIIGVSKENFDCTWQVYWDDGVNPSRTLNLTNIPYEQSICSLPNDPCIVYCNDTPLRLNCEQIRLAPFTDTPCIKLSKAPEGGSLRNGSYQIYLAYTVNEQTVGDYIGISNIQPLWTHEDTQCSLDIVISGLDRNEFEFYRLVLVYKFQGSPIAKDLGLYSTEQTNINIDSINPSLKDFPIEYLPLQTPAYEKSKGMFVVNDYLIRSQPTEQFDFNYQPLANNITTEWVSAEYPADYYTNGGSKPTFLRDEQYAFFIRFIYNTGERSSSYHIPGRPGSPAEVNPVDGVTPIIFSGTNNITGFDPVFKVLNTASTSAIGLNIPTDDGGRIVSRGPMGYWQSTEQYPMNPSRWAGLCGMPIRHHKMPDETTHATCALNSGGDLIYLLGAQFSNIAAPIDNNGVVITNIVGYEILTGGREGNKSIIAKGIIRNMMEYVPVDGNGVEGTPGSRSFMPNYPFNDLGMDPYIMPAAQGNPPIPSPGENWLDGCPPTQASGGSPGWNSYSGVNGSTSGGTSDLFTFHSPETSFDKVYLNASEAKMYKSISGTQLGHFKPSEDHPKHKLLRNVTAVVAAVVGTGYAMMEMRGKRNENFVTPKSYSIGKEPDYYPTTLTYAAPYGVGAVTPIPPPLTPLIAKGKAPASTAVMVPGAAISAGLASGLNVSLDTALGVKNTFDDAAAVFGGTRASSLATTLTYYGTEATAMGVANASGLTGFIGAGQTYEYEGSKYMSVPTPIALITGILTFLNYMSQGGQEMIDAFYNMFSFQDYAWKYNAHGLYLNSTPVNVGTQFRTALTSGRYIKNTVQNLSGGVKINNFKRPRTVALQTNTPLPNPLTPDTSKFIIGQGMPSANGDVVNWYNPSGEVLTPISANYVGLKVDNDNQYGQLQNIKQFPARGCVFHFEPQQAVDANGDLVPITVGDRFVTGPLFAGDNYVNRYTEKVIMPFWWNFQKGEDNGTPFDYRLYANVPFPRFWMNTAQYRMDEMVKPLASFTFDFSGSLPNDMFHLDRDPLACPSGIQFLLPGAPQLSDPGGLFTVQNGYMYTHNSGINDFFVESEINLAFRDWEDTKNKRFYDKYEYTDVDDLFHADIINDGNFYKYDKALSKKYFEAGISASFGVIQPTYYDPVTAETCWTNYPKRLIYSLQSSLEAKKDFWRVYLPKNYTDFKSKVNTILPVSETGALILFPYVSPKKFMGVDTIQTQTNAKFTIGDGGLFAKPPMNVVNSDISHEFGSCESARSAISTPAGVFYISQAQGKIFQYTSKGLTNIANQGMKWWFNRYLPSQILIDFPEAEDCPDAIDNPLNAAGCQSIYDPNNDIVYFSKRDYKVKEQWKENIGYYPCSGFYYRDASGNDFQVDLSNRDYFEDISWTVSFDAKANAWISFHDWHPELSMHSINHFMTTKTTTTTVPGCPPQYTWNGTECCLHIEETNLGFLDISNVLATTETKNAVVQTFGEALDVAIVIDDSCSVCRAAGQGNCQNFPAATPCTAAAFPNTVLQAQLSFANAFLTGISDGMTGGSAGSNNVQVGHALWGSTWATQQPLDGSYATVAGSLVEGNYPGTQNGTDYDQAVAAANSILAGGSAPRKVAIVITDSASNQCASANNNFAAGVDVYVVFSTVAPLQGCGGGNGWDHTQCIITNCTNPVQPIVCNNGVNSAPNLFEVNAGNWNDVAYDLLVSLTDCECDTGNGFVSDTPSNNPCLPPPADPPICVKCECPVGYNLIPGQTCSSQVVPTCKKVICNCINPPNPDAVLQQTGTCPAFPTQNWIDAGTPGWVDMDPVTCLWIYDDCVPANYIVGGLWKHNIRTDKFANYYGVDYPWEVDLLQATGQVVNTIRSVEYFLESYVYKNDGRDRFHDLDWNFDEAIIRNTEQVSGLLKLDLSPKNNVPLILTYPIINNPVDIRILYSKEEQKYRFNQFWDITNDRGEFTGVEQPIYITRLNGYIRDLNQANLNYNKPALQRKKFRHYYNNVILRRTVSEDRKMLLRLNNTKINVSQR